MRVFSFKELDGKIGKNNKDHMTEKTTKYVPVIGMEVHIELKTKSKMFCSCENNPDDKKPNTNICEICLGHPGTLPVPNKTAIEWTVKIGQALGCKMRNLSKFDRKHYFYPDLPKAYQISQYDEPICEQGSINLDFPLADNIRDSAEIGITRVHLEEDTAKLTHDAKGNTLVDFNRAGTPLVEIVTDPDFLSSLEAKVYCQELRTLFRYLGISDANMEKGHMRCEANVSVQEEGKFQIINNQIEPVGNSKLNNKVELKNLNSFKAVEKSIEYEIQRQTDILEKEGSWKQETRGWDQDKQITVLQRIKESAADYRYFPEPDIPPFHPVAVIGKISLPELPQAKRHRFHEEYGFSYADAQLLSSDKDWGNYTDSVMSELVDWLYNLPEIKGESDEIKEGKKDKIARLAGGWMTSRLMGIMAEKRMAVADLKLSPENFAELVALVYAQRINSTNAQKILSEMLDSSTDKDPTHIMEEKGYGQVSDEKQIKLVIEEVLKSNPKQVAEFKSGKDTVLKFLIGMVMKATEGSADPQVVEKILKEQL